MNKTQHFFDKIKTEYEISEIPFLIKQLNRVSVTRPYEGLKLLHNIPFTRETMLKLEILFHSGADVTVTSPSFMEVDQELLNEFIEAGGKWMQLADIKEEVFDIHLDCAAELIDKNPPRIGTVEITGTGTNKYGSNAVSYPVVSVDQSNVKDLEGILGTGEAFVRAFEELTKEDLSGKSIMIFGYGKVGKGIAHYAKEKASEIIIVDKGVENVTQAKSNGFNAYGLDNKALIEQRATEMFVIVTATGVKEAISDNFTVESFKGRYLANMGGEDEFGRAFSPEEVLCDKKPINFFIEKPTLMRYLDPVFYAHNMGVDVLLYANLKNGLTPFPAFISEEIVQEWTAIFNERV